MKTRHLALTALAAVAAIAASCTPTTPGPATFTNGPCPDSSGVTVVIDFTEEVGNHQIVRCALGPQASGLDALTNVGMLVNVNAPDAFPGSVCTINAQPGQGYPYCWLTGGYWSYWRAPSTAGTWDFAPGSPSDGPLVEGTVEGWAWATGFVSDGPRLGPDGNPLP